MFCITWLAGLLNIMHSKLNFNKLHKTLSDLFLRLLYFQSYFLSCLLVHGFFVVDAISSFFPFRNPLHPTLLLCTLGRWLVWTLVTFWIDTSLPWENGLCVAGCLAGSLASPLWMPVAPSFSLPSSLSPHPPSYHSQQCSLGSKSPLLENHWATLMYCFAFQIPSVLANGSTRKIKWGGRKARHQVTFPRTFYSCWVSAGRISLQRSQQELGSGSHLHTALAFSRSLISLSPFPASPRPENLSAPAHLGLVAAMVPTVAIKVLPDFFSFFELSPNFHISHFIEVCVHCLIHVCYLFPAGVIRDTG